MASTSYTPEQIAVILEACKATGVARLQSGNFKVSFLHQAPKAPEVAAPPTPEQTEALTKAEEEGREELEKRIKEDYLAHLRLADPVEYEELVFHGVS